MKLFSVYDILEKKRARQKSIPSIEYHGSGHCIHIGKISPGCRKCYEPIDYANIPISTKCQLDCVYCGVDRNKHDFNISSFISDALETAYKEGYSPGSYSFTGSGEPLLCLDKIEYLMKFFKSLESIKKTKPWYFLYTNGLLALDDNLSRLKDAGINEIRFHVGATNFSKQVFESIERSSKMFYTTVETPSFPPHREKIFEMLPRLDGLGVRYLSLQEIEITSFNFQRLNTLLPDGIMYQLFETHLYDEGLIYDVMELREINGYKFSVLDCSSMVKCIQRNLFSGCGKQVTYEPLGDAIWERQPL